MGEPCFLSGKLNGTKKIPVDAFHGATGVRDGQTGKLVLEIVAHINIKHL